MTFEMKKPRFAVEAHHSIYSIQLCKCCAAKAMHLPIRLYAAILWHTAEKVNGLFVMSSTLNKSLFAQVKGELVFNTKLSPGAFRFYCAVLYLSGRNTHCWYSQIELARFMGLKGKYADRSIRNYSTECELAEVMRIERPGYHKSNKYYPLVKVIPKTTEVINDESPSPTDRNLNHDIDRKQNPVKLHSLNNNQYKRANSPEIRIPEQRGPDYFAKTLAYIRGEPVQWSN